MEVNGNGKGGPTWRWLTGILLGIVLTVVGSLMSWVAVTTYDLSIEVGQLTVQVADVGNRLDKIDQRFDYIDAWNAAQANKLDSTTNEADDTHNWMRSHVLADRAIKEAEQAKHPHANRH